MESDSSHKTKILATVGPQTRDSQTLQNLLEAGVNGFRFNFSHGGIEVHQPVLERVRDAADRPVACMADLQGPKIRVGAITDEPLTVDEGTTLLLYPANQPKPTRPPGKPGVPITHSTLLEDFGPGDKIYLCEGQVRLRIQESTAEYLCARVEIGGSIWSDKGFNAPETEFDVPALTEKDHRDLADILDADFDMVALSFVRRPRDLEEVRSALEDTERPLDLFAKIESAQALQRLDDILRKVDGIIVARGDLGVEIGPERVPFHQKKMIKRANRAGKVVITATQMLESMVQKPVPTRAEVSDVANAVLDGSDVVMLSGETAVGKHPVRSVSTMREILRVTEEDFQETLMEQTPRLEIPGNETAAAMCVSAAQIANSVGAHAIIAPTASGFTARTVSKTYPACPILALSFHPTTRNKASLYQNVQTYPFEPTEETDVLMKRVQQIARDRGLAEPGDRVVLIAGLPLSQRGVTNFLHVLTVGERGCK